MNATTPTEPQRECIDVLPIRGGKRMALTWIPHADDYTPLAGYAVISGERDRTGYAVTQFPAGTLLGFQFTKVGGKGTDKDRESYGVFCGKDGDASKDHCECAGFARWKTCKHSDAARTLLINRWL